MVGLLGRQKAPDTKPTHNPPKSKFTHPSVAYDPIPRNIGMAKEGIIPRTKVQKTSTLIFEKKSAF